MEQIPEAPKYALTPNGSIVNLTRRDSVLKKHWHPTKGEFSILQVGGKSVRYFYDVGRLDVPAHRVQIPDEAEPISGFPDYYVTPYGAVWRMPHNRVERPRLLSETIRYKTPYVQVRNKFGKRTWISVRKAVRDVFGSDAQMTVA